MLLVIMYIMEELQEREAVLSTFTQTKIVETHGPKMMDEIGRACELNEDGQEETKRGVQ
jgi:hypothetical protein